MKRIWHKIELIVDKLIPPSLIILAFVIIIEVFYSEIAHQYYDYIMIADMLVIAIFIVDLIFKYIRMKNVPLFIRRYWLEIIAVFPFYLIFRGVELFIAYLPISESMQSFQMMLHEGLEIEREGQKIVSEAGRSSRVHRFIRFLRPLLRLPRFLKIAAFFERPTGRHHHHDPLHERNQDKRGSVKKDQMLKNRSSLHKDTNEEYSTKTLASSRKAASPLIATVILFLIALVIGYFVTTITPKLETYDICEGIRDVQIHLIGEKLCYVGFNATHNSLSFLVENRYNAPIYGYHMTLIGDSEQQVDVGRNYEFIISPYATVSLNYLYPNSIGYLKSMRLSFYRKLGNDLVLCENDFQAISSIEECSND